MRRRHGRRAIPYADPLHLGRHPFQVFMLMTSVVSSLPNLAGEATAGSVEVLLPHVVVVGWGVTLLAGCVVALVGSYWRGSYANGLTMERVGCILAGSAAIVYGLLVPVVAWTTLGHAPPFPVFTATGIILGVGAACLQRAYDIGTILIRAGQEHSNPVSREGETAPETLIRDDVEG